MQERHNSQRAVEALELRRGSGLVSESHTGCTEGFSGAENYKENAMKTTNSITKFSALESVMKFKLSLLCHSLNAEKLEFYYTFQGTEFGNGICSFHSIFFTVFCPRKPFCAPCA